MTVSYINLMKAQQKPHALLNFPADGMSTAEQMMEASKAAKARLMGKPQLPRRIVLNKTDSEPVAPKAEPVVPEVVIPHGVPLNMLAPPGWRFLLALACVRHRISSRAVLSPSRQVEIVAARHEAICLIFQHTQATLPQLGKQMRRDHTTILATLYKHNANRKLVDRAPATAGTARPKRRVSVRDVLYIQPSYEFTDLRQGAAEEVIRRTCRKHDVTRKLLCGRTRHPVVVVARQEAMHRLFNEVKLPASEIGRLFDKRDQGTVLYAVRCHEARITGKTFIWGKQIISRAPASVGDQE